MVREHDKAVVAENVTFPCDRAVFFGLYVSEWSCSIVLELRGVKVHDLVRDHALLHRPLLITKGRLKGRRFFDAFFACAGSKGVFPLLVKKLVAAGITNYRLVAVDNDRDINSSRRQRGVAHTHFDAAVEDTVASSDAVVAFILSSPPCRPWCSCQNTNRKRRWKRIGDYEDFKKETAASNAAASEADRIARRCLQDFFVRRGTSDDDDGSARVFETAKGNGLHAQAFFKESMENTEATVVETSVCMCGGRDGNGNVARHSHTFYCVNCGPAAAETNLGLPRACVRKNNKNSCGHVHVQSQGRCDSGEAVTASLAPYCARINGAHAQLAFDVIIKLREEYGVPSS